MGFLDDLKRQADALREQQVADITDTQRNVKLVEDICHGILEYFLVLVEQLNVLQPASKARFTLDRQHVFDGLRLTNFHIDSRRKNLRKEEVVDLIVLHWQAKSGQKLVLHKDFVAEWERLEGRLRQGGVSVDSEAVRDGNSRLQEMRYTFTADFRGSVRITPEHDAGILHFQLSNLDALETITFDLPADQVSEERVDELARWLVGQPHAFVKNVRNFKCVEA